MGLDVWGRCRAHTRMSVVVAVAIEPVAELAEGAAGGHGVSIAPRGAVDKGYDREKRAARGLIVRTGATRGAL